MFHRHVLVRLTALLVLGAIAAGCAGRSQTASSTDCNSTQNESATCNAIAGSNANQATADAAGVTIAGGGDPFFPNRVTGDYGAVGGGLDNLAGDRATVAGGTHNHAVGFHATIGGGTNNAATTANATIAGGSNNTASHYNATVSGGINNTASARDTTVGGGSGNNASFTGATVAGGGRNTASGLEATVSGGSRNIAAGAYSTVPGGSDNHASGFNTTVGGGSGNSASGDSGVVSGGLANRVAGKYGAVGGGEENVASGKYSTAPGGSSNNAAGDYSLAAGRRAKIEAPHPGVMLFADSSDSDFNSQAPNEFAARATGGVRLVTAIDRAGNPSAGVRLGAGSGSWESLSDRNAKANVTPVDGRAIVKQLVTIPISTWNYKTQDSTIRHIGPMAQDFDIFGVGEDDRYISTIDANGIALASVQGLYQIIQEQDKRIAALESANADQQSRLAELDPRLTALEKGTRSSNVAGELIHIPLGVIFASICLSGLVVARRWRIQRPTAGERTRRLLRGD
jgi:hypothetical protein